MSLNNTQDKEINLEIVQESSMHSFRTEIPNIVFEMNLDPIDFKAYCVLKKIAGDRGSCFKSIDNLCEEIGIKRTRYKQAKRNLEFYGLIKIKPRKNSLGEHITDLITIVDIWPLNMKIMCENLSKKEVEGVGRQTTEGGSPNDRPQSPNDPKQEPINKIPFKKQQQTPAAVKKSTTSTVVVSSLDKLDIKPKLKQNLLAKYSIPEIDIAVDRLERGKFDSIPAGLQWLLKHPDKWEEPKEDPIILKDKKEKELLELSEENKTWAIKCLGHIEHDSIRICDKYVEFRDKKGRVGQILYSLGNKEFKENLIYIYEQVIGKLNT